VSHNRIQHKGAISEDQIIDLQETCRKIIPPNITQCALCPWPQDEEAIPDAAANLEHIGNCIHQFSLNALPWAEAPTAEATGPPDPALWRKVQQWFERTGEREDMDIQKIDIKTFGFLPTPPRPKKQESAYIPEEYFAESSKESSQVERGSMSLDSDMPEVRGTYSDDMSNKTSEESVADRIDRGEEDLEILEWLSEDDPALQQRDLLGRRQPGTGQWFLESEEYRAWRQTAGKTLFCPGIPGSGKTILTSIVVDDLIRRFRNDDSVGIAYVYCDFRRRQNPQDLIMSLLKQLTQGQPFLPESVKSLYGKHAKRETRPSFDEISEAIQSLAATYERVFLVVDALDECRTNAGSWSKLLTDLNAEPGANVFVTSRFIPKITKMFDQSTNLEIRASKRDIETYLEGKIPQRFHHLRDEIKTGISDAVDGMCVNG